MPSGEPVIPVNSTDDHTGEDGEPEHGETERPEPVVRPRDRWTIIAIAGVALGGILCMMITVAVVFFV
ncbi:MAG: hypothetical protein WKF80_07690 [Thermomicrobiales bacterium]